MLEQLVNIVPQKKKKKKKIVKIIIFIGKMWQIIIGITFNIFINP